MKYIFFYLISFPRYDYVVKNSGTHWYHSHIWTHLLDGQYGPLIIQDPPSKNPHRDLYDKDEIIIFLSDWMHELSLERYPGWIRHSPGQLPKNILINGLGNYTVKYTYIFIRKFSRYLCTVLCKDYKIFYIMGSNG